MVRISASRLDMEEGRIDRAIFKDYGETLVGGIDGVSSTATYTIDIESGNAFHVVLTANCTFTFSNPTPVGSAQTFTLFLKQDATGSRTVTWPASVQWVQGYVPTITSQKNRYDVFSFTTTTAGATWLGFVGAQNFQEKVTLWTWGLGTTGQLGQNDILYRSSPTQVGTLTNWTQATSNNNDTLAVKTDGTLWGWGNGVYGKLGLNSVISRSSPTQVGALTNWAYASAGYFHSAALKTDGTIWSWGQNSTGAGVGILGQNNATSLSSPTQIGALTTWKQIEVGLYFTAALKTDGSLWTWGGTSTGELGLNSTTIQRSSPTQVGALTTWNKIIAGATHNLALKTDGTLWSWGEGTNGRLGHNSLIYRSSPTQVGSDTNWQDISAGANQSLALKTDGTLWSWGTGSYGQLGHNSSISRSSPTQVGALKTWAKIATGKNHSFALKTDGTLWSWGRNNYGQLGQNHATNLSSPVQIGTLTTWIEILSLSTNPIAKRLS